MAGAVNLVPKNGALTVGSLDVDFNSWELSGEQAVEDATPYGSGTTNAVNIGSGTPSMTLQGGGFALQGATGTALGFDGSGFTALGVSVTATADTGCTETGTFVMRRIRLQHARMRATVPVTFEMMSAGSITETWAT